MKRLDIAYVLRVCTPLQQLPIVGEGNHRPFGATIFFDDLNSTILYMPPRASILLTKQSWILAPLGKFISSTFGQLLCWFPRAETGKYSEFEITVV